MNKLFASIGAWIEKEWDVLTGDVKKVEPEILSVAQTVETMVNNPIADKAIELISGGKVQASTIAKINSMLQTLLTGLIDTEKVAAMTPEEALAYFATILKGLSPDQEQAIVAKLEAL